MNPNPNVHLSLLDRVLDPDNLSRAMKQVLRNKGAPGVDGMTTQQLPEFLKRHWPLLRERLRQGAYVPKPVKRVEIPKPDGRKRKLGIPAVIDRFIQQAIAQILSKHWDFKFHSNSYGFRPNRNAHQAIEHLQTTMRAGHNWMIDCDLEAFFDQVNHDLLMSKLKKAHQHEEPFLQLINRYLKAGVMINGERIATREGVPQGGPLSPVLSNIVLNDLDWELERRGHPFARYADDFVVLTQSKAAGQRVLASLQRYLRESLRLKVNASKSAVDRPWKRVFLGYTFSRKGLKLKVADKSLQKLKANVRRLSRRTRGHLINKVIAELREYLLGFTAYFGRAEILSPLRDLDKWIRRRLRCYIWKQWGRSQYRLLRRLGIDRFLAWNTSKICPWAMATQRKSSVVSSIAK